MPPASVAIGLTGSGRVDPDTKSGLDYILK